MNENVNLAIQVQNDPKIRILRVLIQQHIFSSWVHFYCFRFVIMCEILHMGVDFRLELNKLLRKFKILCFRATFPDTVSLTYPKKP